MSARIFLLGRAWRSGGAVLALFVGWAFARADTSIDLAMVPGADADIRLTVPGNVAFTRGFVPLQVRIANRSSRERTWEMEVGANENYAAGRALVRMASAFSFTVGGGQTREFMVYAAGLGGSPVMGRITGPEVRAEPFFMNLTWAMLTGGVSPLATEAALEGKFKNWGDDESNLTAPRRSRRPGRMALRQVTPNVIDPLAWPADWRLWSAYSLVVLREETWNHLDEARRRALREWVSMGGRLLLVPERTKPGGAERHGGGEIVRLAEPLPDRPDEALAKQLYGNRHDGKIDWLAENSHWAWPPGSLAQAPHVGWLTFFVIAFGALVGPLNIFVFAPAGRRHRLFWTVPAISVGGAAVLFGAILIGDGLGGTGMRRALVVLLPEQNQAVVVQRQLSRAGLLGTREFALPADALAEWDSAGEPANGARQLARKDDTASGDWFVSRGMQQHTFRRLVPTRERVELSREPDGTLVAQSTASAVLRDFVYCDERALYWTAAEVPPGQRVKLRHVEVADLPASVANRAPSAWTPGAFYARADRSALGLLPTLSSIRWRDDVVLYTGQLAVKEAKP